MIGWEDKTKTERLAMFINTNMNFLRLLKFSIKTFNKKHLRVKKILV